MGDLLKQGCQWLEQQRSSHCSSPVTYRRGETELPVSATLGQTRYEVEDEYGLRIDAHATDFLIRAADLIPTFGQPQLGDRIVSEGVVYEVLDLAGQGHWRWSDPYRTTIRIHAKEVGTE